MKIAQIFRMPQFNKISGMSQQYPNLKPLACDTVSFGGFINAPVRDNNIDLSLYASKFSDIDDCEKYNAFRNKKFQDKPESPERAVYEHLEKYAGSTLESEPEIFEDYTHKYYDLPEKFAVLANNTYQKNGELFIVRKVPDIFKGLDLKEVSKALDILGAFLEMDAINKFKIDGKEFKATPLTHQGNMGKAFKLQGADEPFEGKGYLLKIYNDPTDVSANGPYGEIAIAQELTKDKVRDVPRFYMGNPVGKFVRYEGEKLKRTVGSWQISEFITKDMTQRNGGIKLFNWLDKKSLSYLDDLDRNTVGNFVVDLGGITNGIYPNKLNYRDYDSYCAMFGQILQDYHEGKNAKDYLKLLKEMRSSEQP